MRGTDTKRTWYTRETAHRRGMVFLRLVLSALSVAAVGVISVKAWLAINDAVKSNVEESLHSQTILLELSEGVDTNGDPVRLMLDKPGSTAEYTVQVQNRGNCDVNLISFGLLAPADGEETPIITEDGTFYLGTQISAALSQVNGEPFLGTSGVEALVSNSNGTLVYDWDTSVNFISETTVSLDSDGLIAGDVELLSASAVDGDSKIRIASGESAELTVTFTFVETNENQNDYRSFSGMCSRRFFAECEVADPGPDMPANEQPTV